MTTHPFHNVTHAAEPAALLDRLGTVFRTFDEQDSGCVSYGLLADGRRWFVKTATTPEGLSSLRRAVALHHSVSHPAVVPLVHSFTTDNGAALVHPWTAGEVLYHPTRSRHGGRAAPGRPMARFRALPLPRVHAALDAVLDAHLAVEAAGFVAVDFYDGCMLYTLHGAGGVRARSADRPPYHRVQPGPGTAPPAGRRGRRRALAWDA
ncbi:serine/threonine protein kinase [Streptomyces sp. NPDC004166]